MFLEHSPKASLSDQSVPSKDDNTAVSEAINIDASDLPDPLCLSPIDKINPPNQSNPEDDYIPIKSNTPHIINTQRDICNEHPQLDDKALNPPETHQLCDSTLATIIEETSSELDTYKACRHGYLETIPEKILPYNQLESDTMISMVKSFNKLIELGYI